MQVNCENPRVIMHPRLAELIVTYRHVVFRGEHKKFYRCCHLDDFDLSPYYVKKNGISRNDFNDCYVLDEDTGECFPMYIEVPCGHCSICKVSKINSFVSRCRLESQSYDCLPWFITLTYDEEHVHPPAFSDVVCKDDCMCSSYVKKVPTGGLCVRDVQLFLKRLRRNIERSKLFDFRFRYVIVGEYGKHTHRPHYHGILFGVNTFSTQDHLAFSELLKKSWQNGFIQHRLMDLTHDDKGTYYTCKYLAKDCEVPDGCIEPFMISSRRNGGIGSFFIDSISSDLRKSLNVNFQYRDKWTGKLRPLQFSRYLIDRVFPSFCRSVKSVFRKSVQKIVTYGRCLLGTSYENMDYEKMHVYDKYFYTGFDSYKPKDYFRCRLQKSLSLFDECVKFYKFYVSPAQCDLAMSVHLLREKFLAKLFEFVFPVCIKSRAYSCRQILNYSSIYQVL